MKKLILGFTVLALVLWAGASFAASLDGNYSFVSRAKANQPDLVGWTGTMSITQGTVTRNLTSPDGKEVKYYDNTLTDNGNDLYTFKTTRAYKPDYVGQEYQNKVTLKDNQLIIASPDNTFNEVWAKK
ncbi:MAG: hypothetical protein ACD_62C00429G0005 [uncultured bacterium]|nr:MAG: hypothetical protein ACD_62C00429G0005 [uncultured bacterium]HLD44507.1 hypothetical protein [bacterium]